MLILRALSVNQHVRFGSARAIQGNLLEILERYNVEVKIEKFFSEINFLYTLLSKISHLKKTKLKEIWEKFNNRPEVA